MLHSPTAFFVLLVLVVIQRLGELVLSRRNRDELGARARPADSNRNWALMVVLHAGWLVGLSIEVAWRERVATPVLWWSGIGFFLAAEALRLWCIRSLGAAWNARALVDPERSIVTSGPYRWMRHPNYLAVLVELVALPVAAGAWITLIALVPPHLVVLARRIRGEDAALQEIPAYRREMGAKGGLLPRLGAREPGR